MRLGKRQKAYCCVRDDGVAVVQGVEVVERFEDSIPVAFLGAVEELGEFGGDLVEYLCTI